MTIPGQDVEGRGITRLQEFKQAVDTLVGWLSCQEHVVMGSEKVPWEVVRAASVVLSGGGRRLQDSLLSAVRS